jgi:hypothetical protein
MNVTHGAAKVIAFMALIVCCVAFATEPMLFRASSFLSPASEGGALTDREKQVVSTRREFWRTKGVSIVKMDASVLGSPDISLEMPDHQVYRFSGAVQDLASQGSPGYFAWKGALSVNVSNATTERVRRLDLDSLDLVYDGRGASVLGTLRIGARTFSVQTLNSKYMMLVEDGLNPSSPPIDAEPRGQPLTRPPRSDPDWAPGLLSDKLKASIATSTIGAGLSPEFCDQVTSCGKVTRISCHPERDGPVVFYDNTTGVLIMACGGHCMMGAGLPGSKRCTACPPAEWQACAAAGTSTQRK